MTILLQLASNMKNIKLKYIKLKYFKQNKELKNEY